MSIPIQALLNLSPRLLVTVTAHNPSATSSLTTYDGAQIPVMGIIGRAIPYNVWVRGGRVIDVAPTCR
ncbi:MULTISPECIES: hypothetical protein [unclassified Stenotrophomonas]|uniref:hypothetical protein n=1 Tax=unclassified Stenotrophomonas TaxID=196198 RepID=UPI002118201E|nr:MULTISPECIES: hypothetical protein [unclassified Stenotrophomonas]